ncbi:MAG: 50S ribosomal protein L23 [Flavobacteriaceae bacterium]|nr:50S ribosomal protein L23 [Flavobacteriaceae bacterium]
MNTNILLKPIVTEKMNKLGEKHKHYGFIVERSATKPEIIKAVEAMYEVKVEGISTLQYNGKRKNRYTKKGFFTGKKSGFKKAIVSLQDGKEINFFESI